MIDFEQELYNRFGQVKDFTLGMRIAKYFYELGRSEKPNNHEGLDEAAKEDAFNNAEDSIEYMARLAGFKAGAEWAFGQGEYAEGRIIGYDDGSFELVVSWLDIPNRSIFKDGDKVIVQIRKKN